MESSAFTVFLSRYYRFPKLFPHLAASLKGMASSNKCLKSGSRLKEYFNISRAISSESYKKWLYSFRISAVPQEKHLLSAFMQTGKGGSTVLPMQVCFCAANAA